MMTLTQFRVTNFRSVMDSGWIDCDDITSLIGINEAGKSNLILALWKLNPARNEGESKIDTLDDLPRHMHTQWENIPGQITFICAKFILDSVLRAKVVSELKCEESAIEVVEIGRKYDGEYTVSFPNFARSQSVQTKIIHDIILEAKNDVQTLSEKTKTEEGIKNKVLSSLDEILVYIANKESLVKEMLSSVFVQNISKT